MSEPSLLSHRKRWPGFERRVQKALAEAPGRIEAALAAAPRRDFDAGWGDSDWYEGPAERPFTVGEAIHVLRRRQGMETARRRKEERERRGG